MKAYPVPEKWVGMWNTISKSIDDAQKWSMDAHKAKDDNKVRLYSKMTADRTQAMGNLMRLAFGELIKTISEERGHGVVHTSMSTDPPELIVFDNDEEYRLDIQRIKDEGKTSADGSAIALGFTSLDAPTRPMSPEGLD